MPRVAGGEFHFVSLFDFDEEFTNQIFPSFPCEELPSAPRRPLGFAGVHKSESAKEMLLSQPNFGPLPPSPPDTSPDDEGDGFPPLPPSPLHEQQQKQHQLQHEEMHIRGDSYLDHHRMRRSLQREPRDAPPAVPPHRPVPGLNTLKTRSMDAGFSKAYRSPSFNSSSSGSAGGGNPGTLPPELPPMNTRRRGAFPKKSMPSPREERRLQTSCSLPETPIFARG